MAAQPSISDGTDMRWGHTEGENDYQKRIGRRGRRAADTAGRTYAGAANDEITKPRGRKALAFGYLDYDLEPIPQAPLIPPVIVTAVLCTARNARDSGMARYRRATPREPCACGDAGRQSRSDRCCLSLRR